MAGAVMKSSVSRICLTADLVVDSRHQRGEVALRQLGADRGIAAHATVHHHAARGTSGDAPSSMSGIILQHMPMISVRSLAAISMSCWSCRCFAAMIWLIRR
jgi:hypothetical protein